MDVDRVMARVREEVARRRGQAAATHDVGSADLRFVWSGPLPPLPYKTEYSVHELLVYTDSAFVENAYTAVLRRAPDPEGFHTHLRKLRSGEATKIEILAHLRWSAEGVARGVHIDGLLVPYTLQRWRRKRFVGPLISWLHGLLRMGSLSARISTGEAVQARDISMLSEHVDRIASELDQRIAALETASSRCEDRLSELASSVSALADQFETITRELGKHDDVFEAKLVECEDRLSELASSVSAQADQFETVSRELGKRDDMLEAKLGESTDRLQQLSSTLDAVEGRNGSLRQTVDGLREQLAARHNLLVEHSHHLAAQGQALARIEQERAARQKLERSLDPLYVAFEDRFRGSAALIRERALPYLDIVREAGVGQLATPILDIGCGRGDWLDVLREHDFVASGVDTNELFVDICRGRGLNVVAGDALEHLRAMPDASLGAVTGMHIAEHLPFEFLIELLDECRRVLCVGGLLAMETPNPENLTVASLNFYMDPTHRNPLPPEAFRWLVEARGFQKTQIKRWLVGRELGAPPLVDDEVPGAASVNVLLSQLHAAPDYAIIARRLS